MEFMLPWCPASRLSWVRDWQTVAWIPTCDGCECTSIHSLTHSLTHSHTHSYTHPLTHSLTHTPTHSLTHTLTHTFTHSLTHTPTHSHTHTLTHSHTHTLTHSHTHLPLFTHTCSFPLPLSLRILKERVSKNSLTCSKLLRNWFVFSVS